MSQEHKENEEQLQLSNVGRIHPENTLGDNNNNHETPGVNNPGNARGVKDIYRVSTVSGGPDIVIGKLLRINPYIKQKLVLLLVYNHYNL